MNHKAAILSLTLVLMSAFQARALPDLIVEDIWSEPALLTAGQPFTFWARVRNVGLSNSLVQCQIQLHGNGAEIFVFPQLTIPPLAPGQAYTVSKSGIEPPMGSNVYIAAAIVDPWDVVTELSEGNNMRQETWPVQGSGPDLIVTDLRTDPVSPISGEDFTCYAVIKNQGNESIPIFTGFNAAFFVGGNNVGTSRYVTAFFSFAPGSTVTVSRTVQAPAAGAVTITVHTDWNNEIGETNETNNSRSEGITVLPGQVLCVSTNASGFEYAPNQQAFDVWNGGNGTLVFTTSANRAWIATDPPAGSSTGPAETVTVTIDVAGLLVGVTGGTVSVKSGVGTSNVAVTVTVADLDGDGIPDGWETKHFGSPANCNPHLDWDQDTQNNKDEWIAGTDPTNRNSRFVFGSVDLTEDGGNIRIAWPTLPGRLYDVFWAEHMTDTFLPLGQNLPHTQTFYLDTTAPQSGYYQVDVRLETP